MVRCVCDYTWACSIVLATLFLGTHQKRLSSRSALLQELLSEYGPTSVRPVYNVTKRTTVEFSFFLTQLIELSEKYQTIQITGWLTQFWQDEFLTWDPAQHDGVTTLFVHPSDMWLPDTTLYKNVDPKFESYKNIAAKVSSTGMVNWGSPVILKCTCRIDARLFPFDIQICELRFSSWAYDDSEVDLVQAQQIALQNHYRDDGVWELLKIDVVRREITYSSGLAYPELSYFIHLKRRPLFHVLNILLPCVLLSILNLSVFALPPESGEKIQLGMTNLLALVLFQQLISDALPPTSAAESPRIGFYFTPMIFIGCTSVMCTVLVLKLFYHNDRRPIPNLLRKFILRTALILFYRLQSHSKQGSRNGSGSKRQSGAWMARNGDSSLMENSETAEENNIVEADAVRKHGCSHCRMRVHETNPSDNLSIEIPPRADGMGRRGTVKTSSKLTSKEVILDWKDVALVIDRAAMALSALVTVCALGTTVVLIALGA